MMSTPPPPTGATDAAGASLLQCLRPERLMLIFARHGQRGGPPIDGLAGKSLTPRGHRQARALAKRLAQAPLDHLYCSDMARAYQTAEAVHRLRPDVPFAALPELRELSIVDQPDYPPVLTDEQRQRLHEQRAQRFIDRLRRHHSPGQVVAVVAHGGMNRLLIAMLAGLGSQDAIPLGQHNASITVVSVGEQRTVIRLANCTRHLRPSQIGGDSMD